ncbi:MAG TPA: hypothetical protein VGW74_06910 [Propionibacteriaceae bacterium]|nr:hypothetical protein [Propionibacteriaceae bacterium]
MTTWPAPKGEPTPGPWYAVVNDLIGGWSVMNADLPPSQADFESGQVEVACFVRREDAELIARLRNADPIPPTPGA